MKPFLLFFLSVACSTTYVDATPTALGYDQALGTGKAQQERGDVECEEYRGKTLSEIGTTYLRSSSGDFSVQPADAATPFFFLNETAGVFYTSGTDYTLGSSTESYLTGHLASHDAERRATVEWSGSDQPRPVAGNYGVPPAQNSLVTTQSVACFPKSVLLPNVSEYPKISAGELYASLIATATTSIEPPILEGNSLEERDLW